LRANVNKKGGKRLGRFVKFQRFVRLDVFYEKSVPCSLFVVCCLWFVVGTNLLLAPIVENGANLFNIFQG
jgi:hypothetical protein